MNVLACDNHVLVVTKDAGVPMVPDASGATSLFELAREWVRARFEKPGAVFLGVVQRLDRPVSGVVVLARTSKAAQRLTAAFRAGSVRKVYWAAVAGAPGAAEGECEQWLVKDRERNRVHAYDAPIPGARAARTRWRTLAASGAASLLELEPLTGRSHQLRVALASMGCPILGDLRYGAAAALSDKSIALHACELAFPHPTRAATCIARWPPGPSFPWRAGWGERPAAAASYRELEREPESDPDAASDAR